MDVRYSEFDSLYLLLSHSVGCSLGVLQFPLSVIILPDDPH